MLELAKVTKHDMVADLGSGDGRISIEFAKNDCHVDGFELDPKLVSKSKEDIDSASLSDKITINNTDFWDTDLSPYTVVAVYPMPDIMPQLEKKLIKELKPGSRVVTNYYTFPNWKHTHVKNKVYLYLR